MAVVVRNEGVNPVRFPGKSNLKEIPAGATRVLADEEWALVPYDRRGAGQLKPVWPSEMVGENLKIKLDYYQPGGVDYFVRYKGMAKQSAADSDTTWTVQRMNHTSYGGNYKISEVQILENVAWSSRASLPWT